MVIMQIIHYIYQDIFHILIFPQILRKISVHEFALSYTDHLVFFSSGLEYRLNVVSSKDTELKLGDFSTNLIC